MFAYPVSRVLYSLSEKALTTVLFVAAGLLTIKKTSLNLPVYRRFWLQVLLATGAAGRIAVVALKERRPHARCAHCALQLPRLRLAAAAFAPCHAVLFRIVSHCGGACAPVARDIQVASAVQFTGLRESALAHAGFLRPVDVAYGRCAIGDALHCFHLAARRTVGFNAYPCAA